MKVEYPDVYFGKRIKVVSNGETTVGKMDGYDYDFTDDGREYLELDIEGEDGFFYGFTEDEIENIEVLKE